MLVPCLQSAVNINKLRIIHNIYTMVWLVFLCVLFRCHEIYFFFIYLADIHSVPAPQQLQIYNVLYLMPDIDIRCRQQMIA